MNILTSYDWLKTYVTLKETPEEFAARVSLSGPGVERLFPQASLYHAMVVGCVRGVSVHPRADKLRLARVDLGTHTVIVVCGGINLQENQWVVVALPGAKVRWHGEGELIGLASTEIRGVASEGMICAANEIGLFEAFPHAEGEILDLGRAFAHEERTFCAGEPLAAFLGVTEEVIADIEVTTNRPDAMCVVGLAREAATILDAPFTWKPSKIREGTSPLTVQVEVKELCPRFMAIRIDGVRVGPSPWWLKRRLLSAGQRSINNVVDITNYILLELGRPMHVFDAAKLQGSLCVRRATSGETLKALDGKTYELSRHHVVVADEVSPQSIAGIMGGEKSGVRSDTTSVIFECAVWDPVYIRRASRELSLSSDSQSLFEKGLSTESCPLGIARAIELCLDLAGGTVSSCLADVPLAPYVPRVFETTLGEICALIGTAISLTEIKKTLTKLGCSVRMHGKTIEVTIPWWRDHDIESGRDLVEEVARMHGYGNIPPLYPVAGLPKPIAPALLFEESIRKFFLSLGHDEVRNYSFISGDLAEKAGCDVTRMLRIQNPLSTEFEFMRTSLVPSLLQTLAQNQERFSEQRLFELANVYLVSAGTEASLPREEPECVSVILQEKGAFAEAKGLLEEVCSTLGIHPLIWKPLSQDSLWHPGRSAQLFSDGDLLATVGEIHPKILAQFKIEGRVTSVHLLLSPCFQHAHPIKTFQPIAVFPEAKRDVAFLVERDMTVEAVTALMRASSPLLRFVEWFDTYRGQGIPEGKKSLAFHLSFALPDRTLETGEVDLVMQTIEKALSEQMGAKWRT